MFSTAAICRTLKPSASACMIRRSVSSFALASMAARRSTDCSGDPSGAAVTLGRMSSGV